MKVLAYLLVFIVIVGGCTFAFFTMATPDVPQQVVTKTLDPKDAFNAPAPVAAPVAPAPAASITTEPTSAPTTPE